ncbi:hypothetical protein NT26_p10366 (plasmid) [Pseudorhizobium banfieldiae]|uniref:Uncharacterized protein n=1 Tax=Pseudorhizobium banfieldiae TaxID=1125847 RepID=L0NNM5_9HYPH|nr:hypothetical protein NT26_p10137 [Pseudorhizobium banfieldiae]CCF22385.1 hypothetical protein NT26_p10366 [Pseudorhizobium banfieldiae]
MAFACSVCVAVGHGEPAADKDLWFIIKMMAIVYFSDYLSKPPPLDDADGRCPLSGRHNNSVNDIGGGAKLSLDLNHSWLEQIPCQCLALDRT